ncbi:MAG: MaoC family dehydratase [Pseudomonadota bacterium]
MKTVRPDELKDFVGKETGVSDWLLVDQERINVFADVTEDHQFIHVDEERAKATPFGGTIAHGFLTLSLLSRMAADGMLQLEGATAGLNYGFDRMRFMSPVHAGKRVRGVFTLMSADEKMPGRWTFKYAAKVEIEGEDKPALMAEWLSIQFA